MEHIESKALEIFIKSDIDQDLVHKLIVKTLQIIPCPNETKQYVKENKKLPSLQKFLNKLIECLKLNNGILMFTMIYLNRLKSKLPANCKGLPSTRHRILLSCLILSIKFNNDFSLKNYDWLNLTNKLFNLKDINLMERQLLYLLNWNLFISESDILFNFNKFLTPIKDKLINNYRMKQYMAHQQKIHDSPKSPAESFQSSPRTPSSDILQSPLSDFSLSPSRASTTTSPMRTSISPMRTSTSPSRTSTSSSRKSSNSSVFSYLDIPTQVNPIIELTALNEQYELNKMIESLKV